MKIQLLALTIAACLFMAGSASAQTKKYQVFSGLTAIVAHTEGGSSVTVTMPGVDLITLDLTQPADNTFQIKTSDYNFDGYKDFAFMSVNQASGMQVYDIFLYHPADKTFDLLEVPGGACEAFGNVKLSAGDKTLKSSCRSGAKSSQDIYKWTVDGFSLELVKTIDNSAEAQAEQAEEKADRKTEKAEQQLEKREQRKAAKEAKKESGDD